MKQSDLPLIRPIGAKLSPAALRFIAKVAELFPGSERDVIIRQQPNVRKGAKKKPGSVLTAREETGIEAARGVKHHANYCTKAKATE
jgi:hypothetical protein